MCVQGLGQNKVNLEIKNFCKEYVFIFIVNFSVDFIIYDISE